MKFSRSGGIRQIGAFIAKNGSNLWGVQVVPGSGREPLVLASDRDAGLWIFRCDP